MKEKKAFVFFNCDEEKSQKSMNVFYNNTVYRDLKGARKALLAKVEAEIAAGRVNASDIDAVKAAIIDGEPTDASAYLKYGAIEALEII